MIDASPVLNLLRKGRHWVLVVSDYSFFCDLDLLNLFEVLLLGNVASVPIYYREGRHKR